MRNVISISQAAFILNVSNELKFGKMNQEKMKGRIFKSSFLESLTKSNPPTTILFYTSLIIFFLVISLRYTAFDIPTTGALYIMGIFTWTLIEYILHRFIFHIDDYLPFMKSFHYMVHGVHHENPRDHERLFMPPVPGLIIAFILFSFWYIFLGAKTFAFMAGLSNGYLLYAYIHFSVHTKPVYHPLRKLWKNHALHHFKYNDKAYGVSSPLWDIIFGTMPPARSPESNNQE
jgi:sterol desaturase/sphingolipid hydroxylase (fatty acid hydroxylase superfamily)